MKIISLAGKFIIILFLLVSCKTRGKLVHQSVNSEFISFRETGNSHFEYLYYNRNDTNFVHDYCIGRFEKKGTTYELYPDSLNNLNLMTSVISQPVDTLGKKLRIQVYTDIGTDYQSQYEIIIFNEKQKFVFNGTNADFTFLPPAAFDNFKIRINLAEHYVDAFPKPAFSYIITDNISVDHNHIQVIIPINLKTFYYKFERKIELVDSGKYWIKNGKRFLKQNYF